MDDGRFWCECGDKDESTGMKLYGDKFLYDPDTRFLQCTRCNKVYSTQVDAGKHPYEIKFAEDEWDVFINSPLLRAMASTYFAQITKEEARRLFYGDWSDIPVFYMDYEGHEGQVEDGDAFDNNWDIFCVESCYSSSIDKMRKDDKVCQ